MSNKKKNYRAMYNKQPETGSKIPEVTSIATIEDEVAEEAVADPVEIVEPVEEPKCEFTVGVVTGCSRLNVREAPETVGEVICVVPVWSEIQVCLTHEYDIWYHVITAAGQEGYCMKQFIEIK